MTMNCDDIQNVRFEYEDGVLEEQQSEAFAQHMNACPACRQLIQNDANALKQHLLDAVEAYTLPTEKREAICKAATTAEQKSTRFYGLWTVGLAAAIIFGVWWNARSPEAPVEPELARHAPESFIVARATEYTDSTENAVERTPTYRLQQERPRR